MRYLKTYLRRLQFEIDTDLAKQDNNAIYSVRYYTIVMEQGWADR